MNRYRFLPVCAFICILIASLFATEYVKVDMANVRSEPSSDASIVARIRLNTTVNYEKNEGEWLQIIDVGYEGKTYKVSGWIHRSLLMSKPVDTSFINRALEKCSTISDSIPWLERRIGLAPDNKTYLKALRTAYDRNEEKERAAAIISLMQNKESVFIACDFGVRGTNILGEIDSSNRFHALTWKRHNMFYQAKGDAWRPADSTDEKIMKQASLLRVQLAGRFWYDLEKKRYYSPHINLAPADSILPAHGNHIDPYSVGAGPTSFFMQLPSEALSPKKLIASSKIFPADMSPDRLSKLEKRWKAETDSSHLGDSHQTIIQSSYGPFRLERMGDGSAFYILEYNCEPVNEDYTYGLFGWDLLKIEGDEMIWITMFKEEWGT